MNVSFDTETFRIGDGALAPRLVCGVFTARNPNTNEIEQSLLGNHPDDGLEAMIEWLLTEPSLRVITHSGGYDYAVVAAMYPHLLPLIFDLLISGRATDTKVREKLLNLSTTGRLEKLYLPDGTNVDIKYGLADLVLKRFGRDRSAEKTGPDVEFTWRLNFSMLDGLRASEYPDEAADYAKQDGIDTLLVFEDQDDSALQSDTASTETEDFQLLKSFVLRLMSCWGMEVDQTKVAAMEAAVLKVIEANKSLLEEVGILRSATSGEPFGKDLERAKALLPEQWYEGFDWSPYAEALKANGIKMKKPGKRPGSINTKRLQTYALELYQKLGEIPTYTGSRITLENGEEVERISLEAEVHEYLALKDPVFEQYHQRQELIKIATQMVPALREGEIIFPVYDEIKETGRTSSYDGGAVKDKTQPRMFPSVNIQQIPRPLKGLDARGCFRPRAGRCFFDVDFTALELACVGHVTYELFGESLHRDLYNKGVDLHAYLGAQLAIGSDKGMARDFAGACRREGIISNPMAVYEAFKALKKHDDEEVRTFFKHYRNFAKPVGLGFPGGLGPTTMVEFARKTYKVIMTEEEASDFREMWRATYPEMPMFFDWINGQVDDYNQDQYGDPCYVYTSPMGMVRSGASFCAAANGKSMQTPGAEAALMGTVLVSRACYDPTQESVLLGCRLDAFIHDQVLGETTEEEELWAPQCEEAARLMREGAGMVLTSINVRTDEAHLTRVWSKSSEPVRNAQGILIPWQPKEQAQ